MPWFWRYTPFKVQGSIPLRCKQFLGDTFPGEKLANYPDSCRETSEGAVYGFHGISRGTRKLAQTAKVKKKNFMSNPSKLKIRATLLLNILSFLIERDWRDQEKSRYGPKRLRWTDGKRSYLGEKLRSVPFQKNMPNGFVGPKQQQE